MGRPSIAPGTLLVRGQYRVEEALGRGGMGVVVRAQNLALDEPCAIKLMHEESALSAELFARFAREAKSAARLKSEHVVRVTDVGRLEDGMPYMVMELLEGKDLARKVRATGPLAVPLVANLIIQVCEALSEAHALGIIHRDIKPSNLFVATRPDGALHIKVLDFGVAKAPEAVDFSLTKTASMLGTPAYMSPEQLRSSRGVDQRTDVWALGIVMYELLEGTRPFVAEQFSELCLKIGVDPAPPMTRTPAPFADLVMKCLEKDVAHRFPSVTDLALALLPFAGDQPAARIDIESMNRLRMSAEQMAVEPATPPMVHGRLQEPTADLAAVAEPDPTTIRSRPPVESASLVTSIKPKRPGLILAVTAVVVGAAIGVVAIVALRGDDDRTPPAPDPVVETSRPVTSPAPPPPPIAVGSAAQPPGTPAAAKNPPPRKKQPPAKTAVPSNNSTTPTTPTKPPDCDPYKSRQGC